MQRGADQVSNVFYVAQLSYHALRELRDDVSHDRRAVDCVVRGTEEDLAVLITARIMVKRVEQKLDVQVCREVIPGVHVVGALLERTALLRPIIDAHDERRDEIHQFHLPAFPAPQQDAAVLGIRLRQRQQCSAERVRDRSAGVQPAAEGQSRRLQQQRRIELGMRSFPHGCSRLEVPRLGLRKALDHALDPPACPPLMRPGLVATHVGALGREDPEQASEAAARTLLRALQRSHGTEPHLARDTSLRGRSGSDHREQTDTQDPDRLAFVVNAFLHDEGLQPEINPVFATSPLLPLPSEAGRHHVVERPEDAARWLRLREERQNKLDRLRSHDGVRHRRDILHHHAHVIGRDLLREGEAYHRQHGASEVLPLDGSKCPRRLIFRRQA
eukprot:scaffold1199_cov265-Pinguiococcus_pyrenoidosus.AAC.35